MALSVSGEGTLVYWPGDAVEASFLGAVGGGRPVWVDRTGQATPIGENRRDVMNPRLSPDNTRLAMTVLTDEGRDVWVDDLERGTSTRLTTDGTSQFPAWSLDGERVYFGSTNPDARGLYSRTADGSGEPETLLTGEQAMVPFSWTPDGQVLTFLEAGDIWTVSLDGDRSSYLVSSFYEGNHDLSPDGRWMAYNSNESGQAEVYIQRYPDLGDKVTISTGGGAEPLWSPDGRELFYRNLDGRPHDGRGRHDRTHAACVPARGALRGSIYTGSTRRAQLRRVSRRPALRDAQCRTGRRCGGHTNERNAGPRRELVPGTPATRAGQLNDALTARHHPRPVSRHRQDRR